MGANAGLARAGERACFKKQVGIWKHKKGEQTCPSHRPPDPSKGHNFCTRQGRANTFHSHTNSHFNNESKEDTPTAKVSFSGHTLPRSYGWLRTSEGKSRRVRILWDTGARHTFVHPRVLYDLAVTVDCNRGPSQLLTADELVGTDQLEPAQGGFGEPGFWQMTVNGEELKIPLIGEHSSHPQVQRIQGVKKTIKMLREFVPHLMMVQLWRQDDDGDQSAAGEDSYGV